MAQVRTTICMYGIVLRRSGGKRDDDDDDFLRPKKSEVAHICISYAMVISSCEHYNITVFFRLENVRSGENKGDRLGEKGTIPGPSCGFCEVKSWCIRNGRNTYELIGRESREERK